MSALAKTVEVTVTETVTRKIVVEVVVGPDDDIEEAAREEVNLSQAADWQTIGESDYVFRYTDPFPGQLPPEPTMTPVAPGAGRLVKIYENCYRCPYCQHSWTETWEAACDSECPRCRTRNIMPVSSKVVNVGKRFDPPSAPPHVRRP